MRIIYPYNEILPKKKAHDLFIAHECASLANLGCDVTLLSGKGSSPEHLFSHYQIPHSENLKFETRFTVRKNNLFNLSWNFPFFFSTQRYIQKHRPEIVILSVRKQGAFHLLRKVKGVRYIYEVHELGFYRPEIQSDLAQLEMEKRAFSQADLITVTTKSLKDILKSPPYSLKPPIEVVPLGVQAASLPPPSSFLPLTLMYVGQLYSGQGLPQLLKAMTEVNNVELKILGGRKEEIFYLAQMAKKLQISDAIEFLGFVPPARIKDIVKNAHAFVAPFENSGRMPFVAHTKLYEYAAWGRPVIAPDLPIVRELFPSSKGALLFTPDDPSALAACIRTLQNENLQKRLQQEIQSYSGKYSWEKRAKHYLNLFKTLI